MNRFAAEIGDQILARFAAVAAAADDGDHVVEVVERQLVAFQDVLAVAGLGQQVGGAAANHVDAVLDEVAESPAAVPSRPGARWPRPERSC